MLITIKKPYRVRTISSYLVCFIIIYLLMRQLIQPSILGQEEERSETSESKFSDGQGNATSQNNVVDRGALSYSQMARFHRALDIKKTYRAMSYNMFGWNTLQLHPWKAKNVYRIIRNNRPDIIGAQETLEKSYQKRIAGNLSLELVGGGIVKNSNQDDFAGLAIFYNKTRFHLRNHGIEMIYEKDQYGQRAVQWANLDSWNGQSVDFFNTHLHVECNDKHKSAERLLQVIDQYRSHSDSQVLLTGDFNANEDSLLIRTLTRKLGRPLVDTYRVAHPHGDATTFMGIGKIDYIFTTSNMFRLVKAAWIGKTDINPSNHFPILADLLLEPN